MGAPSETYVDPSIAANSGTGTIGDPYGDLQYALDTMTRDATNGDRINIKSGTAEVLTGAIDLTSYGNPGATASLKFEGYTTTAGDGGKGTIDGNNGNFSIMGTKSYTHFSNLKLFNTGTAAVLTLTYYQSAIGCELSLSTTGGIDSELYCPVVNCYFYDIAGYGIKDSKLTQYCFFRNGTTNKFTNAISGSTNSFHCHHIFDIDSTTNAISGTTGSQAHNNSIFCNAGTGTAISLSYGGSATNNVIEGFSGSGGKAIATSNQDQPWVSHNAFYDCDTNISGTPDIIGGSDNETLVSSPFAKTGSLPTDFTSATFWDDVYAYFAPVDTGNVYSGFPIGSNQTKGAVGQPVGGGAGGGLLRVNMNGNVFG